MSNVGATEFVIVLVIIVLLFGLGFVFRLIRAGKVDSRPSKHDQKKN